MSELEPNPEAMRELLRLASDRIVAHIESLPRQPTVDVEGAAEFARDVLKPGGAFLCKVLQGGTETALLAELKRDFDSVKHVKPPASRADSAELYLLARGFRG